MTGQHATKTAATLEGIPVFFTERMVADVSSYSPSAGKPREVMKSWKRLGIPLQVMEPVPVSKDQFYLAHDPEYVDDLLACRIENGFGNNSREVAATFPWTSGAMLSASREAINNGYVAVAPCSGFHHAAYDYGGGYCSLNGLMVAAIVLLHEGVAERVGILDLDMHVGDGTQDILKQLRLKHLVRHFTAGAKWHRPSQAKRFLTLLPSIVEAFAGCNVLLFQAGADPHIDDPLGGWLSTEELAERDKIVFETARRISLPVGWCLAGGYQVPLRRVLDIHDNTLLACGSAFSAQVKMRGRIH